MQTIALAKYESVSTIETEDRKGWVSFGIDNNYPQYLIDLAQDVPVHGSLVTGIAQMIIGKRINCDKLEASAILAKLGIVESIQGIAYDLKCHGGYYLEIIKTMDGSGIAKVNHYTFETIRLSYNESGEINGYWYSRDWKDTRKKRNTPVFIQMFDMSNPDCMRGMVHSFMATPGSQYYPKPDYISALKYIELARQISIFHLNQIENGLFPSFVVQFNNGQPVPEKAMEMKRNIENSISGAKNAGKAIILFNENKDEAATFEPFPISDADKQYQFLSDETDKKTFVGHRVTTPLIFGIRDSSGLGSNTDEMKQGLEIFMNKVIKPYRDIITRDLKSILQFAGVDSVVDIVDEDVNVESDNKADVSYNGAQIASAIDIIAKIKEGILTQEQAIVFLVQFLQLPEDVARSFFSKGDAVANLMHHLKLHEKKKCCLSHEGDKFTSEDEKFWIDRINELGEEIDAEEWVLVDEQPAHDDIETEQAALKEWEVTQSHELASVGSYANGNEKSDEDVGLYKLRFVYGGELSDNSRAFCVAAYNATQAGKVWRLEDITAMGEQGVNGQFAPEGQSTYDIFTWKGGVYCHHFWKRQIYFRKRVAGKFLPNDGLKNDKRVGNVPYVRPKGAEGIKPVDTPTRGSLKYS
jgi:hypothetical protein